MKRWKQWLIGSACLSCWLGAAELSTSQVEAFVEEINSMRENLVHGVSGAVTPETFAAVCKPVGMRAKSVAKEKHWTFRQVSKQNRNPANQPSAEEAEAIHRFEQDPALFSFWNYGDETATYYRRITVQATCLACHGDRDTRPDFIKTKYPDDLAYGFKAGDLRGIFAVTINKEEHPKIEN